MYNHMARPLSLLHFFCIVMMNQQSLDTIFCSTKYVKINCNENCMFSCHTEPNSKLLTICLLPGLHSGESLSKRLHRAFLLIMFFIVLNISLTKSHNWSDKSPIYTASDYICPLLYKLQFSERSVPYN